MQYDKSATLFPMNQGGVQDQNMVLNDINNKLRGELASTKNQFRILQEDYHRVMSDLQREKLQTAGMSKINEDMKILQEYSTQLEFEFSDKRKENDQLSQRLEKESQAKDKIQKENDQLLQRRMAELQAKDKIQEKNDQLLQRRMAELQAKDKIQEKNDQLLQTLTAELQEKDKIQEKNVQLLQTLTAELQEKDRIQEKNVQLLQTLTAELQEKDRIDADYDRLLQTPEGKLWAAKEEYRLLQRNSEIAEKVLHKSMTIFRKAQEARHLQSELREAQEEKVVRNQSLYGLD
jgi:hypothetical protein